MALDHVDGRVVRVGEVDAGWDREQLEDVVCLGLRRSGDVVAAPAGRDPAASHGGPIELTHRVWTVVRCVVVSEARVSLVVSLLARRRLVRTEPRVHRATQRVGPHRRRPLQPLPRRRDHRLQRLPDIQPVDAALLRDRPDALACGAVPPDRFAQFHPAQLLRLRVDP
jgi:hypothetical protein